jgi:hypothetical protein
MIWLIIWFYFCMYIGVKQLYSENNKENKLKYLDDWLDRYNKEKQKEII